MSKMTRRGALRGMMAAAAAVMCGKLPAIPKPSPAAMSIPFATLPMSVYIRGPRYCVVFDKLPRTPEGVS